MEEKKRTIVMFGDSLTDYFPMEKLKDIDAQFINSGVAVSYTHLIMEMHF